VKDSQKLELDDSLKHPFYVHDFLLQKRYRFDKQESATSENVERMIESILSKTIKPFWVKSEPIPETQGLIQKVVSDNFHDTVWKYQRDYVVLVYEESKRDENLDKLLELFTKVAEIARGELPEDKIAFGIIDVEKNELPDVYHVSSQPTPALLIAGANSKLSPAGYTAVDVEEQSVEDLLETLHDYCYNYRQKFVQAQKQTEAKIESIKDEL
jgi:thioredoxin-like negative regulator of GroEL